MRRHSFTFVLACACAAAAGDFDAFGRGDEVEVVLEEGATLRGVVRSIVDGRMRLELLDAAGALSGSLTLAPDQVRSVRRTGSADLEALDREARDRDAARPAPPRVAVETEPPAQEPPPEPRSETLLRRFPPESWNEARRDAAAARDPWLLTDDERAFLDAWDDWKRARDDREAALRADLARRFPPEDGWGRERRDLLVRATAVIGRALTAEEREFVERFADWERGVAEVKEAVEEEPGEKAEASDAGAR